MARHRDPRLLGLVAIGYPLAQAVVRPARALDRVLAPGFAAERVRRPVFVVGHPRSGTTWLHRLLATDPRFTTLRTWQLLLPAVTLYRFARRVHHLDPVRDLTELVERKVFAPVRPHHPTGWTAPEEDSWLFLHQGSTPSLEYLTGDPSITADLWIPDDLEAGHNRRRMRWYRRSLQRHLHASPTGTTLLSKDPHFTGWIRTLAATFPDARFVMLVREPAEAIASRLALVTSTWRAWEPTLDRRDPRLRAMFDASVRLYRHADACWDEISPDRRAIVRYLDLLEDPLRTVARIYERFGYGEVPPSVAARAETARRRVPSRPVELRHFGLTRRDVDGALADVVARWSTG